MTWIYNKEAPLMMDADPMPQPYEPPNDPALEYNTSSWAQHYLTATLLMLDGLAQPEGEIFAYGYSEALAALDAAHVIGSYTLERELANQLALNLVQAAHVMDIRLAQRGQK